MSALLATLLLVDVPTRGDVEIVHDFVFPHAIVPNLPDSELTRGVDGAFYGTSAAGGAYDTGTVYRVTATGDVSVVASFPPRLTRTLFDFPPYVPAGNDLAKSSPLQARLVEVAPGEFLGMTDVGGSFVSVPIPVYPYYTIKGPAGRSYQVSVADGNITPLYQFQAGPGQFPLGGLLDEGGGSVLGSTLQSTLSNGSAGGGIVFRMGSNGVPTVLADFSGIDVVTHAPVTARYPRGALARGADGSIWGTTTSGSDGTTGSVFKLTESGLHVVWSFSPNFDGDRPLSGLVRGPDGNFYGTTALGGVANGGTVFRVTPAGESGTLETLANFDLTTGTAPGGTLNVTDDGSIYGVTGITSSDGGGGVALVPGKVFKLNPDRTVKIIADPSARLAGGLTASEGGSYIGAMRDGGTDGMGGVYEVSSGDQFAVLTQFDDNKTATAGGLVRAPDGRIIGTTILGGAERKGSLFQVAPDGTFTELASFSDTTGFSPRGLVIDPTGVIRGIATKGGENGAGTIFKYSPSGALTAVVSFSDFVGLEPAATLLFASDGNFYGTTRSGGPNGGGTVFRLTPDDQFTTLASFSAAPNQPRAPCNGLVEGALGAMFGILSTGPEAANPIENIYRITRQGNVVILGKIDRSEFFDSYSPLVQRPNGDFAALTAGGTVLRIPKDGTSATSAGYLERRTWDPPSLPVSETLLAASDGNFYGIAEGHSIFRVVPAQLAGGGSGAVDIVAFLGGTTPPNLSFSPQRNVRNLAGLIESDGYLYGVVNRVAPDGAALGGGSLFRVPLAFSGTTVAPPQAVTGSGATLRASITADRAVTVYFEYGTTAEYGSVTGSQIRAVTDPEVIEVPVSGLTPNTLYHFRVVVTSNGVTGYGADATFQTHSYPPPEVVTTSATDITDQSVTLNGVVFSPNGPVVVSFEYGLKSLGRYHVVDVGRTEVPASGTPRAVAVTIPVHDAPPDRDLVPNSTYQFRLVAAFDGTTTSGGEQIFTTGGVRTVITQPATQISGSSALLHASIRATARGSVFFEYGLSGFTNRTDAYPVEPGSTFQSFQAPVGNLFVAQYFFRAVYVAEGVTRYGGTLAFSTRNMTVTTRPAGNVTSSGALLTGNVQVSGEAEAWFDLGKSWFEYGTSTEFAQRTTPIRANLFVPLEAQLTNLPPDTTYYFRLVADTAGHRVFGEIQSFFTGANRLPIAGTDRVDVSFEAPTEIDVLSNDRDPDADNALTILSAENGAHGATQVVMSTDGRQRIRYTPASASFGPDTFSYIITDGLGGNAYGTVNITVAPPPYGAPNSLPHAQADTATVLFQTTQEIDVLANDSDPDGDLVTLAGTQNGAHGTAQVVTLVGGAQRIRYTPAPGYSGSDDFVYSITDGYGGTSVGTVHVSVGPDTALPDIQVEQPAGNILADNVSRVDFGRVAPGERSVRNFVIKNTGSASLTGLAVTIDGTNADAFALTNPLSATALSPGGSVTFAVRFSPTASGTKRATLSVASNDPDENPFAIALTNSAENRDPIAEPDVALVTYQTPKEIDVLGNDSDPDKDPLIVTSAENGAHGTVQIVAREGRQYIRYAPDRDFLGSDTFTYRISDDLGGIAVGQVNVTVSPPGPQSTPLYTTGAPVPIAGDPTSGLPADAKWESFGVPSIADNGRVAFAATMGTSAGSLDVVYVGRSGEQRPDYVVARKGDLANGIEGATFAKFNDPLLNDNGTTVFLATLKGVTDSVNVGIWTDHEIGGADPPLLVAQKGAPVPGVSGGKWKRFTSLALSDGPAGQELIAFTADMLTGQNGASGPGGVTSRDDSGLWIVDAAGPKLALREGQMVTTLTGPRKVRTFNALKALPGAPGQGHGATVAGVLARISFADGTSAILRAGADGALSEVARRNDPVGGSDETMMSFQLPTQNSAGDAAFVATLGSSRSAVVLQGPAGVFTKMLGAGEKPSGFDAVIRGFSAVAVDSSGRIVCAARLAGNSGTVPSDIAIVTVDEAGPKVVARVGTRPPGFPSGVEWSSFPSLALSQNAAGPVFVGKLRASTVGTHKRSNATIAQTIGLWATDSAGVPQLIVRTGDMFDARRKIRTFSALDAVKGSPTQTRSINTQGELIYRAGLSDGSEALVTVRLP